jgi:hypothetical protein
MHRIKTHAGPTTTKGREPHEHLGENPSNISEYSEVILVALTRPQAGQAQFLEARRRS